MNIAVVDDEVIVQKRLKGALEKEGHRVDTFASGEELLGDLEVAGYDLIFLDVVLPGISGMEVLQQVKARVPDTEVILITGHASIDHAVAAIKKGAFHYVEKPLRLEEIRHLTRKALDHKRLLRENRVLKAKLEPLEGWGEMGISFRMKEVFPPYPQGGPAGLQHHRPRGERHRQGTGGPAYPSGKHTSGQAFRGLQLRRLYRGADCQRTFWL